MDICLGRTTGSARPSLAGALGRAQHGARSRRAPRPLPQTKQPPARPGSTPQPDNLATSSWQLLSRGSLQTGFVQHSELTHSYPSPCEFAATSPNFHTWLPECTAAFSRLVGCTPFILHFSLCSSHIQLTGINMPGLLFETFFERSMPCHICSLKPFYSF